MKQKEHMEEKDNVKEKKHMKEKEHMKTKHVNKRLMKKKFIDGNMVKKSCHKIVCV